MIMKLQGRYEGQPYMLLIEVQGPGASLDLVSLDAVVKQTQIGSPVKVSETRTR